MISTDFLGELNKFNLAVSKRITSKYTGTRTSSAVGRGTAFTGHRIYASGDDFRMIDWKVYARTDDLYIKLFEEERNLTVHIIIDRSASMNYGKNLTKFVYASMIGVGFACLATKANERFQFATFSEGVEFFQPKRGMAHLAAMVSYLNNIKTKGISKFSDSLKQYKKAISSRGLIVVISDFLIDLDEVEEGLYSLGSNHQIKLVQVLDYNEKKLPIEGDVRLTDSETNQKMRTYVSPKLKSDYLTGMQAHAAKIQTACNALNARFYSVDTGMPIFDSFFEILKKD